jgi:hypothetical protein
VRSNTRQPKATWEFTAVKNEFGTDRHNSPGVQLGFGYNTSRYLRLAADFGAQTHSTDIFWANGERARANLAGQLPLLLRRHVPVWREGLSGGQPGTATRGFPVSWNVQVKLFPARTS